MSASFSFLVKQAAEDVCEVFNWRIVAVRPPLWSCTCRELHVTHVPCKHACVVILFMQQSIRNYVDYHMTMEAFKVTYTPTLYPIPDCDKLKVRFDPT